MFTSGSGATGNGIQATAASTNGHGFGLIGTGTGQAISGQLVAANFAAEAITDAAVADGAIDRATFAANTGLQSIRSGTAQTDAGQTSTSIKLDGSARASPDFYKHNYIYLTGGTGIGQYRLITGYNGSTKVATVTPAWVTNPDGSSTFAILPAGIANVEAWLGAPVVMPTVPGVPTVDVTHVLGSPVCN